MKCEFYLLFNPKTSTCLRPTIPGLRLPLCDHHLRQLYQFSLDKVVKFANVWWEQKEALELELASLPPFDELTQRPSATKEQCGTSQFIEAGKEVQV